jgi:hypothetical protein
MIGESLRAAVEGLDDQPSAAFDALMRERLFSAFVRGEALPHAEAGTQGGLSDVVVVPAARRPRRTLVVGAAAVTLLIGGLVWMYASRREEASSKADLAIAQAANIAADDLGLGWQRVDVWAHFTTRDEAALAASIPACTSYAALVLDAPERHAATSEMRYLSPKNMILWNNVSVFESRSAASAVMDKIAEPGFRTCWEQYLAASMPMLDPASTMTSESRDAPPLNQHGERQVAFDSFNRLQTENGPVATTWVNVFIQIDRVIVYVNPVSDFHDSLDPKGSLDKAMSAATKAVELALDA